LGEKPDEMSASGCCILVHKIFLSP